MYRRLTEEPPENIIESWLAALDERGAMMSDGLAELEAATGQRVTHSRLSEWRRGIRVVPSHIQAVMAVQAAPALFRAIGVSVSEQDAKAIARAFSARLPD